MAEKVFSHLLMCSEKDKHMFKGLNYDFFLGRPSDTLGSTVFKERNELKARLKGIPS